jgi:EAL domain-containing protein (putative c-di-GMP-specific phosphodiesterase class I)
VGYDEKTLPEGAPANGHYKAYILGQGSDGIAKTPAWASAITGIPAERIVKLAREIGTAKPAYISQGWGPQRHANGELSSRAIAMLPILTGNVGVHGGNSGARESTYTITIERMPLPDNPVKTQISCFSWTDAIARGPEMTATRDGVRGKDKLDVPIKFIWNYAGNCITNQHSDINKTHEILQDESKCEMIVVIDNFMTSSAKYADLLLPDLMTVEQAPVGPVVGFEALLRWQHPVDGLLAPDQFLPLAEKSGLIIPIGNWVIDEACRQLREWHLQGHEEWSVAVNLSTLQFEQPQLVETVLESLARHNIPPHTLILEVTETTAMNNPDESVRVLTELTQAGVKASIDDFGTGYSSLLYLKRLPACELKIDRAFVNELSGESDDATIVSAIVALAKTLNLKVVAEGVETPQQQEFLTELEPAATT